MFRDEDPVGLRNEIYRLKKQLSSTNSENSLLKVKVRKLQDEVFKRDKQIDTLLDPQKSPNIRKILFERSAMYLINVKEKNDKLEKCLLEKEALIKRLQSNLEIAKLYSKKSKHFQDHNHFILEYSSAKKEYTRTNKQNSEEFKRSRSISWTPGILESNSFSPDRTNLDSNSSHIREQYKGLSRDHLLSIIESLKNNRYSPVHPNSRKSSPESDLDRIEVQCESPHQEIQQLHHHFLEMLTEVDCLKDTIAQLQNSQEKTEHVLKQKDTNIDKLAKEIKNLRKPKKTKGGKKCSNQSSPVNVYNGNRSRIERICTTPQRNFEKSEKQKTHPIKMLRKISTKNAMIQVNSDNCQVEEDPPKYVEQSKIFISKKKTTCHTSQDNLYDDEVFDECDSESVAIH